MNPARISTHERCPRCGRLLAPLNGKLPAHRMPPTRPYNRSSVPLTGRDRPWCADRPRIPTPAVDENPDHIRAGGAMSDLRARLAEALRKHRQGPGPSCRCCGVDYDAPTYTDHLADVLMSLPGIAIVDTTAAEAVAEAICNSHYGDIEAWAITYGRGREHWEKAAKAALLAAANAAESVTK